MINEMKKMKIFFTLIILALGFVSCEDDALKAVLKSDVTPNVLQSPSSDAYVLTMADKDEIMETFEWTAPDYGFAASVKYVVEMDIAGNDFADAVTVGSPGATLLNLEVNTGDFNDLLLGMGLVPEEAGNIEIRVVSTIGTNVPPVYSNVETFSVTAYATSFPPIYGMGSALKGWGPWPANAVEWQSTEYKKYETIAYFTNGNAFRWFAQLDWGPVSYNFPYFTTVDPLFVNAADDDSNLKVAGATGWYKVNVDLGAKTVTAESVNEPVLYMMGAALNGWGPWNDKEVKMTYIKPGLFETTATFKNDIFRFFGQADWGPTSYNYNYFSSVDPNFELNANDNDNNFRYIGTPGTTKITVDLNAGTVVLGTIPDPVLFITGDDFGWGWGVGQYLQMTYKGGNTFEATATLTVDKLFRFFPQKDWSPSYNYSYFTTVDAELANQGVGTDENFKYVGATGSRKITVNMTTKTVSVD
jgi:starch-binding outer membrane protein SusE/F